MNSCTASCAVILEMMIHMACLQFNSKRLLLTVSFSLLISFFFFGKFLKVLIYHSSLSNRFIWNHRSHFNIAFMGKSVSTNVAVLLTNYNVTLGDDITILNKITSEDHFMGINYDE